MKTVAIVQCRLDSHRLPGKAFLAIGGKPILEHVINRTRLVEGVDEIVVATSSRSSDNAVHHWCHRNHIADFRGPAEDVLSRFMGCARQHEATHILRITADCPLLDPELNTAILAALYRSRADYASIRTNSVGFVQEAFTMGALEKAWVTAQAPSDREHVIPFMTRNLRSVMLRRRGLRGRFCVDTTRDLRFLRGLYELDDRLFALSAREIMELASGVPASN